MKTEPTNNRDMMAVFKTILLVLTLVGLLSVFVYKINEESHKQAEELVLRNNKLVTRQDLIAYADALPNTALRSNLYIILAAESLAESEQLNIILQEYARLTTSRLARESAMGNNKMQ